MIGPNTFHMKLLLTLCRSPGFSSSLSSFITTRGPARLSRRASVAHGFTHLRGPVECGPEGALNPCGLNELERPPSVCITGCRVGSEKFAALLYQIAVGALCLLGHEVVECPLKLLPLAAGLHLRPDQHDQKNYMCRLCV